MKIGVLALQGAFAEHRKMLEQIQIDSFEIRQKDDFEKCPADGYIIPGWGKYCDGKIIAGIGSVRLLPHRYFTGYPGIRHLRRAFTSRQIH